MGRIRTYSIVYVDLDGRRLEKPDVIALICFEGVEGGIIHRVSEVEPEAVKTGMPVEAVLRPRGERRGSITDILYFRPVRRV